MFEAFSQFINDRKTDISNFIQEVSESQEMKITLLKYGGLYAVIISVVILFYYTSIDPKSLSENKYVYGLSIAIPLLLVLFYVLPFSKNMDNPFYKILLVGLGFLFFITMLYYYSTTKASTLVSATYIMYFLSIMIVICAMAIFLYVFSNYLKSLSGVTGFVAYLLFYLPCLLIDFVKYIINEFKMTTNAIYILFIFEIVLILIYLYLPLLISKLIQKDGISLLENSAFLDIKKTIGNSDQLKIPDDNVFNIKQPTFRREYSISMWVYLNTQSSSFMAYSRESPIFNYGNGKPKIVYYNNPNNPDEKDKVIVYYTDSTARPPSYEFTMTHQKWHQIVLNYFSDHVDLFVDGDLENTYDFDNNQPTYLATDDITIGSVDGLDGAVCNIKYYTSVQTKSQIANSYNLLMNKNPPTNNL
jgi:hypothetical protein